MSQQHRISKNNTSMIHDGSTTHVILHSTRIVTITPYTITLNSGGYQTATTKTRMNQVSNEMRLGYQVYQKDHEWFVAWQGETLAFTDGMILTKP